MFLIWICKTVLERKKENDKNVILNKWEGRYLGGSKKQSNIFNFKIPRGCFQGQYDMSIWLFTCSWFIFHFVPNLWIDDRCLKLILDGSSTWYRTHEFALSTWYLETDFDVLWLPNHWIKRFALFPAFQYFKMLKDDLWERFSIYQCINHSFLDASLHLYKCLSFRLSVRPLVRPSIRPSFHP